VAKSATIGKIFLTVDFLHIDLFVSTVLVKAKYSRLKVHNNKLFLFLPIHIPGNNTFDEY